MNIIPSQRTESNPRPITTAVICGHCSCEYPDAATLTAHQTEQIERDAVKPALTDKPVRPGVENREFAAFGRRIIRAFSRRVAAGDIEGLTELVALRSSVDDAISAAVIGLRAEPYAYSWAEIGARLNISKQAAQQRWGANL